MPLFLALGLEDVHHRACEYADWLLSSLYDQLARRSRAAIMAVLQDGLV